MTYHNGQKDETGYSKIHLGRRGCSWHDRHKRQLESATERRLQAGARLTLRQAVARAKLRPVTIRLATQDIDMARGLAARKGIDTRLTSSCFCAKPFSVKVAGGEQMPGSRQSVGGRIG